MAAGDQTQDDRRAALSRRAEEIRELKEAEKATAFTGDQREETGELSTVDQHPADTADFLYQRELQQSTREMLDRQAAQVDEALQRQAEGTYGVCANCGQPIDPERLAARPEATLCIDCQREADQGKA